MASGKQPVRHCASASVTCESRSLESRSPESEASVPEKAGGGGSIPSLANIILSNQEPYL